MKTKFDIYQFNPCREALECTENTMTKKEKSKVRFLPAVSKHLFLCDICGKEKSGRKFPVLDENWNKQSGLNQCEDCFKDGCGLD